MVVATVTVHFAALLGLMWMLRVGGHRLRVHETAVGQGAAIMIVVLGLMAALSAEVWAYAALYLVTGALHDIETALYFSLTSFTTIGYGDVVLTRDFRLLGAIEGANGLLLFGWSTAFLVSVVGRMRMLEHDWLESGR